MNDQSKMSSPRNSLGLPSVISSPELASGATHFVERGGRIVGQSGPEAAPANLSARQAKERGLLTSGTYGQHFIPSSLAQSLGNKLRAKTVLLGSKLFTLT